MGCTLKLRSEALYLFFPPFNQLGATPLLGSGFEASSVPVFLSSLHCTDEDHSLLDDCAHSQLGLAVCDEDSGLAGVKCLGEKRLIFQCLRFV